MFCWQCRSDVAGATPNARMTRIREGRCLARNVGFCWRPHGGFRRPWTRFLGWICQARSRRIVQVGPETFTCMTAASGVGHSYQVQERGTDRFDTPPQAHLVEVLVFCNELRDQRCDRSIPAAKKTDAALRIALSRPSYAFSRCSRCNSADSSEAIRARALVSISLWRTYLRTVSAVPMASRSATAPGGTVSLVSLVSTATTTGWVRSGCPARALSVTRLRKLRCGRVPGVWWGLGIGLCGG